MAWLKEFAKGFATGAASTFVAAILLDYWQ